MNAISRAVSKNGQRRHAGVGLMIALIFAQSNPAAAYLKFGVRVGDRTVTLKWAQTPVRYYVSNQSVAGVSTDAFRMAVGRAFATWQGLPSASITYEFAGFTSALPNEDDGMSTLGFLEKPELDRVLASTSFLIDDATGALIEADIFFNSAFPWSVAENGESGRFDVQSIALHEIGHMSGLGHSALGETELRESGGRRVIASEAVMFPIAFAAGSIAGRTPRADDIAGISDLYPDGDFRQLGSISGRVTKDGRPLFGAHVVNFTLNAQGQFSIDGLSAGPHILRVEPLDDADIDSFFESTRTVDLEFRVTYANRLIVVPRRGDSGPVDIEVARK